jgi:peptide/nickel transport system permease protein
MVRITGDPVTLMVGPRASAEARERITEHLGLDKPVGVQYRIFLTNIFQGDFGDSFKYKKPALDLVLSRVPATLELIAPGLLLAIILAIPIGVYSAARRGSFIDIAGRAWAFVGMSAPPFWVGLVLIFLLGVKARILPIAGRGGIEYIIMPAVTLAWGLAAGIVRLTRSSMMEVLNSGYITFARTKGVSQHVIIWKHAFKNAAIPVVTYIMLLLIILLSGAIVIENVFGWPGIGRLVMGAVVNRDFPIVQAVTLLVSFSFIMINLIADILYAYLDPKIRY